MNPETVKKYNELETDIRNCDQMKRSLSRGFMSILYKAKFPDQFNDRYIDIPKSIMPALIETVDREIARLRKQQEEL